jgi:hypothetical protein
MTSCCKVGIVTDLFYLCCNDLLQLEIVFSCYKGCAWLNIVPVEA